MCAGYFGTIGGVVDEDLVISPFNYSYFWIIFECYNSILGFFFDSCYLCSEIFENVIFGCFVYG
jgi:hypothetical protein